MTRCNEFAIFDMDGTLLDSMGFWRGVREEWLLAEYPFLSGEMERFRPYSFREVIRIVREERGITIDRTDYNRGAHELMAVHYARDIRPYRNVVEELRTQRERGARIACVTATMHPYAQRALAHFGLLDFFDVLLSPEDNHGLGKESPTMFSLAMEKLGCREASACTLYEDSLYSIRVAHEMGIRVTAVLDPANAGVREEILALSDAVIVPET